MYHAKCLSELCDENYVDESGRRIVERVKDHNERDHKSHILKHSLQPGYEPVLIYQSFARTSMETKESEKLPSRYLLNNYVQHLISAINQYGWNCLTNCVPLDCATEFLAT